MKVIIASLLLISLFGLGAEEKSKVKELSDKITKRKGYCSPLDKMSGKKDCVLNDKEKEVKSKIQEAASKIKKRKGYCSPLDKLRGKNGCK